MEFPIEGLCPNCGETISVTITEDKPKVKVTCKSCNSTGTIDGSKTIKGYMAMVENFNSSGK